MAPEGGQNGIEKWTGSHPTLFLCLKKCVKTQNGPVFDPFSGFWSKVRCFSLFRTLKNRSKRALDARRHRLLHFRPFLPKTPKTPLF